jgi:hypothetical protein
LVFFDNFFKFIVIFYSKFEKYDKTCYKGMEQHFYGRETKGPGAYLKLGFIHLSPTKKAS